MHTPEYQLWSREKLAEPELLSISSLPERGQWVDWDRQGEKLFVSTTNGLQVLDLTDLNNLAEFDYKPNFGRNGRLALQQDALYLLQNDIVSIVDITQDFEMITTIPTDEPILLTEPYPYDGTSELPREHMPLYDIAVMDNQLFVLTQEGTAVFDVSDPFAPEPLKRDENRLFWEGRFYTSNDEFLIAQGSEYISGKIFWGQSNEGHYLYGSDLPIITSIYDMTANNDVLAFALGENGVLFLQAKD